MAPKGGGGGSGHHHRSVLSQSNKPYKSRHASKGSLKAASKGEHTTLLALALALLHEVHPLTSSSSEPTGRAADEGRASSHKSSPLTGSGAAQGSKLARRNLAKQTQQAKRAALVESNRIFSSGGSVGEKGSGAATTAAAALDANAILADHLLAGPSTLGLGKGTASSGGGAPRICAVIDLAGGLSWEAVRQLEAQGEGVGLASVPGRSVAEALARGDSFCELEATRFRQTIQFLPLPYGALYATLDACKCADFVLLVLSSTQSIEPGSWGELCLRCLQAQGSPTVLVAAPTLHPDGQTGVGGSKKAGALQRATNETRKSLLSFARYFAPDVEKVHALDEAAESSALVRTLATSTPKRVAWRDFRAWSVAEQAEWVPNAAAAGEGDEEEEEQKGLLKVQGWIRGTPMSANRLVHLPDFGDFSVSKITYAPPAKATRHPKRASKPSTTGPAKDVEMMADDDNAAESVAASEKPLEAGDVLEEREDGYADDLQSTNEVDDLTNEQTWPTEEEEQEAPAAGAGVRFAEPGDVAHPPPAKPGTTPKSIAKALISGRQKKLKGESELSEAYKAAWFFESDDEEEDEEEEEDGEDEAMDAGAAAGSSSAPIAEDDEEEDAGDGEEDFDEDEEKAAWEAYQERRQREREEREEANFPDEVDTPMEIPARQRFARYRGLKSFRTSPWDPYEDLPRDYAKIFQFDNYGRTKKRVEASALLEGVQPGTRVCFWIENVPRSAAVRARASGVGELPILHEGERAPFVLFGLLRHEHKKSVLHFTVTRNTEYDGPVKSKDPLVLCLGPRRFRVNPIYSQNSLGSGKRGNGVHKFERYLSHGISASVATVYAPITFGGSSAPALLLRERDFEAGERGHDQRGVGARQTPHLVAMGSLMGALPTRINAKRIFITGHPYKIHKRTATIRFMFFNADDVRYFKPIELHTKYGRTGNITEPLGTHGYLKAHFDAPITQMDTVLMPLYKRVYPKWSGLFTSSREEMPLPRAEVEEVEEEMEE